MNTDSLASALQQEHREIDAGIVAYTAAPSDPTPLMTAIEALRRHIYLEEEYLFPLLRAAEPGLAAPVSHMLYEHARIWATLDDLEIELEAGSSAAMVLCKELAAQLEHHNLKEEKVLYPLADAAGLPEADRLAAHLESEKLPEGWICQAGTSTGTNAASVN